MKLSHFLHEIHEDNRHRILALDENGDVVAGAWVEIRDLAVLEVGGAPKYFANADSTSPLPFGVFTAKEVPWKAA